MTDFWLSFILFSCALFHAWIQIYNRMLLCLDDSPIKVPTHVASFFVIAILPVITMYITRDTEFMSAVLNWNPHQLDEWIIFMIFFVLLMMMLWRMGLMITDLLIPSKSHRIIRETNRSVPVEKYPSRLPLIFKDQDTTWDIEFRDIDLQVRHLPTEFDGLSLVMVSDVHLESDPRIQEWLTDIREYVNALAPDIIVFTGDYVNHGEHVRESLEFHGQFKARIAKLGVLGNHDYWTRPKAIRRLAKLNGIKIVTDDRFELTKNGRKIVFTGTDAPWNHKKINWKQITQGHPSDCRILISHTPDNGPAAADHDINLILSGHNHGGQIRLPTFGAVAVPSKYGRKFSDGIFDLHESCAMVVSRGIGCSRVGSFGFLRMNCRPEIIRLNLRAPMQDITVPVEDESKNVLKNSDSESQVITEPAFKKF